MLSLSLSLCVCVCVCDTSRHVCACSRCTACHVLTLHTRSQAHRGHKATRDIKYSLSLTLTLSPLSLSFLSPFSLSFLSPLSISLSSLSLFSPSLLSLSRSHTHTHTSILDRYCHLLHLVNTHTHTEREREIDTHGDTHKDGHIYLSKLCVV